MFQELKEHRPITIIAIMQVGIVVVGWILTAGHMKLKGYPETIIPFVWNPNALFVRHWGLSFFLIPLIWVAAALFFETNRWFTVPRLVYLAFGILITLGLFLYLGNTSIFIGYHPIIRSVR